MGFAERGALLHRFADLIEGGLGDGWVVLPTVVENAPRRAHLPRGGVRPGGDDCPLRQ
jgi:hypothetical protein